MSKLLDSLNITLPDYQILANLLETDDMKCKVGSLRILRRITSHPAIRKKATLMGGIELLIKILSDPDSKLQLLAAETMANLAKFRNARTIVRKNEGIPKLIDLLDVDMKKVMAINTVCRFLSLIFKALL